VEIKMAGSFLVGAHRAESVICAVQRRVLTQRLFFYGGVLIKGLVAGSFEDL
jgi:hypothetical protein